MKKLFLLFLIFSFISSFALATNDKVVYDDWTYYEDEIQVGDITYFITSSNVHLDDPAEGKILIKKNADRYVIPFNDCVKDILYEYCFENRSFNREKVDIDNEGKLQPALKIKLIESSLVDTLEKTKTFSESEFLVGDKSEVIITIKNIGDTDFTNIVLIEEIPENFEIIKSEHNVKFLDNKFVGLMNLFSGSSWTTSYTIKAKTPSDETYASNITYDYINSTRKSELFGKKTLKFLESHEFKIENLKQTYNRGKRGIFSITITNKETVDLFIDELAIKVPLGIRVNNKKELIETSYNLFGENKNSLKPDESVTYELALDLSLVGNFTLDYGIKFHIRDEEYVYENENNFTVGIEGIQCNIEVPDKANAANYVNYKVVLENVEDESFYEIKGNFTLLNETKLFDIKNMNKESVRVLSQGELLIPFALYENNQTVSINAKYRTVDSQFFECNFSKYIKITPSEKLFSLDMNFKEEESERNETTILVVKLKNQLDITIDKEIQIAFSSSEGSAKSFSIPNLEDSRTFEVNFSINEFLRNENASVTVNAIIPSLENYKDYSIAQINISNPYYYKIEITDIKEKEQISNSSKEAEERRKLTFIDKIIFYLKNFFN